MSPSGNATFSHPSQGGHFLPDSWKEQHFPETARPKTLQPLQRCASSCLDLSPPASYLLHPLPEWLSPFPSGKLHPSCSLVSLAGSQCVTVLLPLNGSLSTSCKGICQILFPPFAMKICVFLRGFFNHSAPTTSACPSMPHPSQTLVLAWPASLIAI